MIRFASEVGEIVGANGLYRRGSMPVTIDPETGDVEAMETARFQSYIEGHLVTFVWKGSLREPQTMSLRESQACLRSDALVRPLRKLRRVNFVRLPVMRSDGQIELLPKGWDPSSSIFTMPNCIEFDPGWDLERARLFLEDFLGEFPFEDSRARAAHILAMVAVFGADLLPAGAKPLNFAYRANATRAGKNLLVATALAAPYGRARIQPIPEDASEFRKILDTEALNGSRYVVFDEVTGRIVSRQLNSFLTASIWTGRVLGGQKSFSVPQEAIAFLIGNNIDLSGDLAGRCVLVDLYVAEADPQERAIRRIIDQQYLSRKNVRADILAALFALVRYWDSSLRPSGSAVFRGFETFCRIFGGIVEAAGYECPLRSTAVETDPDLGDMTAVVEHLAAGIVSRAEFHFDQVVDACRALNSFEWLAAPGELKASARSILGKIFSGRFGGCIFRLSDGRRVRWGRRGENRQRRYVVEVL